MTNENEETLATRVANKRDQVTNYVRILNEYRGRWYDMGARRLAELKAELADLEAELAQSEAEPHPDT